MTIYFLSLVSRENCDYDSHCIYFKGNDDWHDGLFGTISRTSTSHVTVNLVLSGISLPNSLPFKFSRTARNEKSLIFTTCYFTVETYRWFKFIVSWRISFQFLPNVSNNEITWLRRIQKILCFLWGLFSTAFKQF